MDELVGRVIEESEEGEISQDSLELPDGLKWCAGLDTFTIILTHSLPPCLQV